MTAVAGGPPRSLVITGEVPFPAVGGAALRTRQTIEALRRLGPVTLVEVADGTGATAVDGITAHRLDRRTPERGMHRLTRLLPRSARNGARERLRQRHEAGIGSRIAGIAVDGRIDLVVVEGCALAPFLPPRARLRGRLVYDAHNIEAPLWRDVLAIRAREGVSPPSARRAQAVIEGERRLVAEADQVWACSDADAELLRRTYAVAPPCIIVPNGIDVAGFLARPSAAGPIVLYTANFEYAPNIEAARRLADAIFPRIRSEQASTRLVLCGRRPPPSVLAYGNRPGITVTGEVADVRPWLAEAAVALVPLRHGGGTRLKILEAFAAGTPVVSTAKGAEGLAVEDGEHLLLAETDAALAEASLRLIADPALGRRLAATARTLIEAEYSWDANAARIRLAVETLLRSPPGRTRVPG